MYCLAFLETPHPPLLPPPLLLLLLPPQLSTWCVSPDFLAIPEMRQAQLAAAALPYVGYGVNADHGAGCKRVAEGRGGEGRAQRTSRHHAPPPPTSHRRTQHPPAREAILLRAPRLVRPRAHLRSERPVEVALLRLRFSPGHRRRSDRRSQGRPGGGARPARKLGRTGDDGRMRPVYPSLSLTLSRQASANVGTIDCATSVGQCGWATITVRGTWGGSVMWPCPPRSIQCGDVLPLVVPASAV